MKKKRVTKEEKDGCERVNKKLKINGSKEEEEIPTEEEVEEFYTILKRMKVVVKYFDERGKGVTDWREELEKPDLAVDHAGDNTAGGEFENQNNEKGVGETFTFNQGFDLNAVAPEASDSGA